MTRYERSKYQMLLRIRDFGKALGALFPESSAGARAFAIVAEAAARIEAQMMARTVAAKAGQTVRRFARQEVRRAIAEIATTARGLSPAARGEHDTLRLPTQRNEVALLATARTFLVQAKPVEQELIALGLRPTFLADLEGAATRFDAALELRRNGRRQVALSNEAFDTAVADARKAVAALDIIVPNVLRDQPDVLAGWRRDRLMVMGEAHTASDKADAATEPNKPVPLAS